MKNGHLLFTVQTLAVGKILQITGMGLLYGDEKLKLSALALSLLGDLTVVESVPCTQ